MRSLRALSGLVRPGLAWGGRGAGLATPLSHRPLGTRTCSILASVMGSSSYHTFTKPVTKQPPPVTTARTLSTEATLTIGMERTFLMVKPDGVQRGLVGDIVGRLERKGFSMVAMKFVQATTEVLAEHYIEHEGKPFYDALLQYILSGPVVAMVWEGEQIITISRVMIGATNPLKANPATIRGDFAVVSGRNVIHGSDSPEAAEREIRLWFREDELVEWSGEMDHWVYGPTV